MDPESPLDSLWQEYGRVFHDFDDLTLARWLAQTLGQLEGRTWRLSHPLLGAYRLAAQVAHDRQIWLKRLATPPAAYLEAPCCRAPLLPLLTRDILESGLVCQNCSATAAPFDELPAELQSAIKSWSEEYAPVHAVAHWDEPQQRSTADYDRAFDNAAASVVGAATSEAASVDVDQTTNASASGVIAIDRRNALSVLTAPPIRLPWMLFRLRRACAAAH